MQSQLPSELHQQVIALLYEQASAEWCECGRSKRLNYPVCDLCAQKLCAAKMHVALHDVYRSLRPSATQAFAWRQYECLIDVLRALQSGKYSPRQARQDAEAAHAWH